MAESLHPNPDLAELTANNRRRCEHARQACRWRCLDCKADLTLKKLTAALLAKVGGGEVDRG